METISAGGLETSDPGLVRRLVGVATGAWLVLVALTGLLVVDPPTSVDHSVQVSVGRAAAALASALPVAKGASTVIAHLGASSLLVPVILVVGVLGWSKWRSAGPFAVLALSYAAMAVVVSVMKSVLARPEPYDASSSLGRSYPSGHTASAVAVWGGTALVVSIWARSARIRFAVTALAGVVVLAVAATMIGRSAHWVSDVVAGAAVGSGSLFAAAAVVIAIRAAIASDGPSSSEDEAARRRCSLSGQGRRFW